MITPETAAAPATELVAQLRSHSTATFLSPNMVEFIYSEAYHAYLQKHYDTASKYFTFLVLYRPVEARFLYGLAATHQCAGHYQEAISYYEIAAAVDPLAPEYPIGMAECQLQLKDRAGAATSLATALDLCRQTGKHATLQKRAQAMQKLVTDSQGAS